MTVQDDDGRPNCCLTSCLNRVL